LKKHLKYLISLLLALVVIAGDGTLNYQSKSADYYQSSQIIVSRELDFKNSRLYKFTSIKFTGNTSFLIFMIYKTVKEVLTSQTKILLLFFEILYQKINSFIKQAVFVNEIINSGNFKTSLYTG